MCSPARFPGSAAGPRRIAARLLCFAAIVILSRPPTPAAAADPPTLALELVAAGLSEPVAIAHAGDERLFVALHEGRVVILVDGEIRPTPFLDITDRVLDLAREQGLASIAFPPDHAETGHVFAAYTALPSPGDPPGMPVGDTLLARYSRSEDPDVAPADSERILLRIGQPGPVHNGGELQFGPDGYLYVGSGDGGFGGRCVGQADDTLLGKILRLDVARNAEAPPYYAVPPDNPFAGPGDPPDEVWAKGLRNPWRFSFDRATGDLYIADVGAMDREEVSFQPAAGVGGENYGWGVEEGTLCLPELDCGFPVPPCGSAELTPPILEFGHETGCAVIGGYVYRGSAIPELEGFYLYGDFCTGTLWAAERDGVSWLSHRLAIAAPGLTSLGEDAVGEIYLATGDSLYRLVRGEDLPGDVCRSGPTTLCLGDGRFEVTIEWRTALGSSGLGAAVSLTEASGYFWFFDAANPEVFVKVLDACVEPFDRFWVFAAGLTDVETRLRVEDKRSGQVRLYENALGSGFQPIRDTSAFDTCP